MTSLLKKIARDNCYEIDILGQLDNDPNYTMVSLIVKIDKYLHEHELMKHVSDIHSTELKNVFAEMISYHRGNENKVTYRDLMIDILGLIDGDLDHDFIKNKKYGSSDEDCPICLNSHDMMLNCGHVVCMSCAESWYLHNENPLICVVCQESIDLAKSYCL